MTKTLSPMYETLLARYLKGYITDSQLDRYVALGRLTAEEAEMIRLEKQWQDDPSSKPNQELPE